MKSTHQGGARALALGVAAVVLATLVSLASGEAAFSDIGGHDESPAIGSGADEGPTI